MSTAKVSKKGQLVIPVEIRRKHMIESGTVVEFLDYGEQIILVPIPSDPIGAAEGWLKSTKSTAELLSEARSEEEQLESKKLEALRRE